MIIADTGFWIALINRNDKFHKIAVNILQELQEGLVTTWPVLTETCHLLTTKMSPEVCIKFMNSISNGICKVWTVPDKDLKMIPDLMKKYKNLPMDLADASLVYLAEELGEGKILTTDKRDFNTYRWKNHKPFLNLMNIEIARS